MRALHLLLRRFWRLSPLNRWLAAQASLLLTGTWLGLHLVGYKRIHSWLERWAGPAGPVPVAARHKALEIARVVDGVVARLPFASCLPHSLVLWAMLRRRGILAELHVGVRKEGSFFSTQAWVEYGGLVLNDQGGGPQSSAAFEGSLRPGQRNMGKSPRSL